MSVLKRRPLFFCALFLLAGVYAAYFMQDHLPLPFLFLCLLVFFVSLFFTKAGRYLFSFLLFFLVGAILLQQANAPENQALYPYVNEYVEGVFHVVEEPQIDEEKGTVTLLAEMTELSFLGEKIHPEERLQLILRNPSVVPRFGQCFRGVCRLEEPKSAMNSGGFDYQLHLKSKGIFFVGYPEPDSLTVVGSFPLSLGERIYALNRRCFQIFSGIYPKDAAAVCEMMVLGRKTSVSDNLKNQLKTSGLSHVTSVSGMHVMILVSILCSLYAVFRQNRGRFIWLTALFVLFFMTFTGGSPPVLRAVIMVVMGFLAYCLYRREDSITSLVVAGVIIVFVNPLMALHAGFILSFVATFGILLFAQPMHDRLVELCHIGERPGGFYDVLSGVLGVSSVTLSAQLFMMPVASFLFGSFSLWGFINSLLTAPLAPFILAGGILTAILGLIHPALAVLSGSFTYPFIKLFLWIVRAFGDLKNGMLVIGVLSGFGLYVYGLFLFGIDRLIRRRKLESFVAFSVIFVLLLGCLPKGLAGNGQAEVTFINVGQGDCTLITLPKDIHILVDAGGTSRYEGNYDVGREVVLPYLQKRGITKIDYMVATHPHEDHIRGLESLMDEIMVGQLIVPLGFGEEEGSEFLLYQAERLKVDVVEFRTDSKIVFGDGSRLVALSPDGFWAETEAGNEASLILNFVYGDTDVLLTGDLGAEGEAYLLQQSRLSDIDILKVGHHGSPNGTTEEFLAAIDPEYAYIPCGENTYGHPSPEVISRLERRGAAVFRADRDRDVSFVLDYFGIKEVRH